MSNMTNITSSSDTVLDIGRGVWTFFTGSKYLEAIVVLFLFIIVARIIMFFIKKYLIKVVQKTQSILDDELLDKTEYPFIWSFVLIGFRVSLSFILDNTNKVHIVFFNIVNTLIVLLGAYIIGTMLRILFQWLEEQWSVRNNIKTENIVFPLLDRVILGFIYIIALMVILKVWSVSLMPMITSFGVAGVVLGFALKDSIGNLASSVSLAIDKSYDFNDLIRLETGEIGTVISLGFRSTKIKTFDNEIIVIPNGRLSEAIVKNYAKPNYKERIEIKFGVEYGTSIERVRKVILPVIRKVEFFVDEPEPFLMFESMGDYSLNFKLYFWIKSFKDRFDSIDQGNSVVYDALNNAGIGIPFPTRTIYENTVKRRSNPDKVTSRVSTKRINNSVPKKKVSRKTKRIVLSKSNKTVSKNNSKSNSKKKSKIKVRDV